MSKSFHFMLCAWLAAMVSITLPASTLASTTVNSATPVWHQSAASSEQSDSSPKKAAESEEEEEEDEEEPDCS